MAVVAIGGNAILKAGQAATFENQMANLKETCSHLVKMVASGYDIIITHGNGPQVGNILLQNELMKEDIPPMPLDVCVAESQGQLGYMIQMAMGEELSKVGLEKTVVCILTRVIVDSDDPAFEQPAKPIGPYYSEKEAEELERIKGWRMGEDLLRGGFRRLIPSPQPLGIVECKLIKSLVLGGETRSYIIIAGGGGGIPVVRKNNSFQGVEAVVDKDLAACVLASSIGEKLLILLTDVDYVYLNFGRSNQMPLREVRAEELEGYLREGHFPAGSMGPKVEAALRFLRQGGERVIITSPQLLEEALDGRAGTHILV